jgi:hypothetical protein
MDPAMAYQNEDIAALERLLSAPRIGSIRRGCADATEWIAIEARSNFSCPGDPC